MNHLGHKLEEKVVGDGEQHSVGRLVHIYSTELAVIFRYLRCMWRHYLVLAVTDALIHECARLGFGELIEHALGYVLDNTFGDCILPAFGGEKHL